MSNSDEFTTYRPASLQQKLRQLTAIQQHRITRQKNEAIEELLAQTEDSRRKLKKAARRLKACRRKYLHTKVSSLAEELMHNESVIVPYIPSQDGIVTALPNLPVSTELQDCDPKRDVVVDRYPFMLQVKSDNCEEARFDPTQLCNQLRQSIEKANFAFPADVVSDSFSLDSWADLVTINHKCNRVAAHLKNSDGSCSFQLVMYVIRLRGEVQPPPEAPRFDDALRAARQARESVTNLFDVLLQQQAPATTE